jgi:hypothetical protein
MVAAVFNLLMAVLDYSPARPGPNPTAGFLLAGFVLSMFVFIRFWGALSPILPREVAIRGALVTGCVLFGVAATLGYGLSIESRNGHTISTATGPQKPCGEPWARIPPWSDPRQTYWEGHNDTLV